MPFAHRNFFTVWNGWIILCYYKGQDFIVCFSLLKEGPSLRRSNFTCEIVFRVVSLSQLHFELFDVLFYFSLEELVLGSRNTSPFTKPFSAPGG